VADVREVGECLIRQFLGEPKMGKRVVSENIWEIDLRLILDPVFFFGSS
jgi:hypothetical protein